MEDAAFEHVFALFCTLRLGQYIHWHVPAKGMHVFALWIHVMFITT